MWNSVILDVAIGLAFVYSLLALLCTTVNEWVSGIFQMRGKMLEKGIEVLLSGQGTGAGGSFLSLFDAHPLVAKVRDVPGSRPAYMEPRTFALAVMDLVTPDHPGAITFAELQTGIQNLPDGSVKTALLAVIQNAGNDINLAQNRIEGWFNDQMNRVSGWYTRRKQIMTVVLALLVTLFVNADTMGIARKLWITPVLRQEVVANSQNAKEISPGEISSKVQDLIGWDEDWTRSHNDLATLAGSVGYHIPGWILTVIAVSLGSPFWFDLLNRFMNLRAAGKSPAESAKGPRKDSDQP